MAVKTEREKALDLNNLVNLDLIPSVTQVRVIVGKGTDTNPKVPLCGGHVRDFVTDSIRR